MAMAMNKNKRLPATIVTVLDKDLIHHASVSVDNAASVFGRWTEWLVQQMIELIKAKKDVLPLKAKKDHEPMVYWLLTPNHKNYDFLTRPKIAKFNNCLEAAVKPQQDMRCIHFKERWDYDDQNLVVNDSLTSDSLFNFYEALDASVQFNVGKRKAYLTKLHFNLLSQELTGNTVPKVMVTPIWNFIEMRFRTSSEDIKIRMPVSISQRVTVEQKTCGDTSEGRKTGFCYLD